ncbi:TPA: protein translocase subunit SecF [Candidatus Poribacteria bacterium]|nr:protein translocase subunit SecF [Candidatus Poribacteria bacterium]
MRIVKETNIDFIGVRYYAYAISAVVILAGLISLIVKGGPTWGVDFQGGVVLQAKFDRAVTTDEIRSAIESAGVPNVSVQHGQTKDEVIVSSPEVGLIGGKEVSDIMKEALIKSNSWVVDEKAINVDRVSPSVGRDLIVGAIKSLSLGLALILIYMAIRFEFRFGLGGIVALFHDVAVTLGFFSLFNEPIDLSAVAAFLTIIGFSINDTIVIFDRVRENMKLMKGKSFDEILNVSVNQNLGRTIITTGTALLTIIAIFAIARVGTLHTLSFALLVGFISGVYSTLYIASPVARAWHFSIIPKRFRKTESKTV